MTPRPVVPRHVAACQHSPVHLERWAIWTWKRDGGSSQTRVPYSCNSWRCEVCRRHEAAVTFARLKQATRGPEGAPLDPSGWCMLVLTIDRDGYYSGAPWSDVNEAYRSLGSMTRAALQRIGRTWGPETRLERSGRSRTLRTVRALGNRWAAVVEAHRSGWPHVNLMVWCPELAALLRREQADRLEDPELADAVELARDAWKRREAVPRAVRELARQATLVRGELAELLTDAGWGLQSSAEAARSVDAVCGYAVKLAGLHDASAGELAKITQVPTNAPERFRRLRSGKGFLPPRQKDESVTGCMMRRRRSAEGDWELQAINAPKDERQEEQILRARAAELALIDEEEQILSRNKGRLPAMPPLRRARFGKLESHRETSERRSAMIAREMAACG
jgi:hypothetical protein